MDESRAFIDLYEVGDPVPGAASTLYRAHRIGDRQGECVVRPIRVADLGDDEEVLEKMQACFTRLSLLRHPNIVRVQELHEISDARYNNEETRAQLGVAAGDLLLVTEFAPGIPLDTWRTGFPDARVPLPLAVEAVRQVCVALDYAHRRGVFHLDLKPSNIHVETTSKGIAVRVMDFTPSPEECDFVNGVTAYQAPELAKGLWGAAADQWSVAMLFLELVYGSPDPEQIANLPARMKAAVSKALDPAPTARHASCTVFARALGEETAHVSSSRKVGRLALLVAGALALVVAGAWWWTESRDAEARRIAQAQKIAAEKKAAERKAAERKAAELKAAEEKARQEREAAEKARAEEQARKAAAEAKAAEEARLRAEAEAKRVEQEKRRREEERLAAEREKARKAAEEKAAAELREQLRQAKEESERARREATVQAKALFAKADWANALVAARKGDMDDPEILFKVGACLLEGLGGVTNRTVALEMIARAAEREWPAALTRLGELQLEGAGGQTNAARAVALFRRAVEKGDAAAMWNLAQCIDRGRGVLANPAESAQLVERAAKLGLPRAQYAMGLRSTAAVTAADWFRRSAEQGYAPAQAKYGDCFIQGLGVATNSSEAVKWYARAAERGDAGGQRALGLCYDNGYGVSEDSARAVALYRSAADGGDLLAKALLSQCLFLGIGAARDDAEAWRLARESADAGCAFGQYMAGVCCETGRGTIRSRLNAKLWYEKALAQGLACARERLERMHVK